MFTEVNESQGTSKFQTASQNKFNHKTSSNVNVSTFTPKVNKTITPNESAFISLNRRTYNYND